MTWELHSPDLPFLNEITIVQVKRGFFEHCLVYAPFFSAICALIGTGTALWIASQARKISNEQKIVAQNKLEYDLFDRRNEILSKHLNCFMKIIHTDFKDSKIIDNIMSELYDIQLITAYLFKQPYLSYIRDVGEVISKIADIKDKEILHVISEDEINYLIAIKANSFHYIKKIEVSMDAYTPDFISNKTPISKHSPASPDTPQPAAPTADQSPPTP